MALYLLRDKGSGPHTGGFPQASAASRGGQRPRRNSIPARSLDVIIQTKAPGSATFLTIYPAESLFLVTSAHEMAFLPVHFVLQGAKGTKTEPPPLMFISEHLTVGFETLVISGNVFV